MELTEKLSIVCHETLNSLNRSFSNAQGKERWQDPP